jgi:hypothetical protein
MISWHYEVERIRQKLNQNSWFLARDSNRMERRNANCFTEAIIFTEVLLQVVSNKYGII